MSNNEGMAKNGCSESKTYGQGKFPLAIGSLS